MSVAYQHSFEKWPSKYAYADVAFSVSYAQPRKQGDHLNILIMKYNHLP